jgi:hypothetical protein
LPGRLQAGRRGRAGAGQVQRGVAAQDAPVQFPAGGAGGDPEFLVQQAVQALIGVQGLVLAPAAVQREDQLAPQPLA